MNPYDGMSGIMIFAVQYAALLLCISVHESGHALVAYLLGDETSKQQNRISINPLDHIDLFGTVIFPVMAFFFHIPVIGWAKPVMVDPRNLRDPKRDDIFISAAGPASNLLLAFLLIALYPLITPLISSSPPILGFYQYAIFINVILAFFNMIPIPPLDGSGILRGFLPPSMEEKFDQIARYGFFILYALLLLGVLNVAFGFAGKFIVALQVAAGMS